MSTRKAIFLEILSGLHAFLMCMGLYPILATLCGLSGMGFVRFHAVGMLLFIPIFSSRILLRKIRNMIGYLLVGVLVSAFCFYAAFHLGTFFRDGNWVLGMLTGALSFFVFCVHTHAKITYGRMKRDFQSMPGGSESFTLREWEVPTVFSTPAMGHWIWFTLLFEEQEVEEQVAMAEKAGLDTSKDMQVLHAYYEKARYSEEGCTREEYEEMS